MKPCPHGSPTWAQLPLGTASFAPRRLWAWPGLWDTQPWSLRSAIPPSKPHSRPQNVLSGNARRRRLGGAWVQQPPSLKGLAGEGGPAPRALLCTLPPTCSPPRSPLGREQGATALATWCRTTLSETWHQSFRCTHFSQTFCELLGALMPFEDHTAGAAGRHAVPIHPAEAGGGHRPPVKSTMVSPLYCVPAPSCPDILDKVCLPLA